MMLKLARPFLIRSEPGAQASMYLASATAVASISGRYFANKQPTRSSRLHDAPDERQQLRQISAQLVGREVNAALEN
jgi:hypothetical protein